MDKERIRKGLKDQLRDLQQQAAWLRNTAGLAEQEQMDDTAAAARRIADAIQAALALHSIAY